MSAYIYKLGQLTARWMAERKAALDCFSAATAGAKEELEAKMTAAQHAYSEGALTWQQHDAIVQDALFAYRQALLEPSESCSAALVAADNRFKSEIELCERSFLETERHA